MGKLRALLHELKRVAGSRHLAGLEMRLSLAGEDLEASLVDASDRAVRCIPAAAAEANTLQVWSL